MLINSHWIQTITRLLKTNGFAYALSNPSSVNRETFAKHAVSVYISLMFIVFLLCVFLFFSFVNPLAGQLVFCTAGMLTNKVTLN